jgi:predicted dehydrogenase
MNNALRVAVVGARGIGKHHAKWFARAGCEVTALYGTTPDSAERAAAALRELFPFTGRVYSDWDRFLAEGDFQAASVCSPAEAHAENVIDLAGAGKHVLCEKPLAWNWEKSPAAILAEARAMVAAALRARVVLAVNAQYPAGVAAFEQLHREVLGRDAEYPRLAFQMETKGQPRSAHGPAEVWVDLGPHPLALLDTVAPGGAVRWETLRQEGAGLETRVTFTWQADGRELPVEMTLRRVPGGTPQRRVSNGLLDCEYEGRNVNGEFLSVMRAGDCEWAGPDFMRVSVERFIAAAIQNDERLALVPGAAGLRQLEALVGVWERCWRE